MANDLVKFLDGSDERGGLHRVYFRATVGTSGALTVTRSSPSITSVTRTAAGAYTVLFDSTWVPPASTGIGSTDVSALYNFAGDVVINSGTHGTSGTDIYIV